MPRITVYNSRLQSGLSRSQIETVFDILPKQYSARIQEVQICIDRGDRNVEPFEYVEETKTILFAYPVSEKSPETVATALECFLVGLARIKSKSRFFVEVRDSELSEYADFVNTWNPKIMKAYDL